MQRAPAPVYARNHRFVTTHHPDLQISSSHATRRLMLTSALCIAGASSLCDRSLHAANTSTSDTPYLTAASASECRRAGGRWVPISRVPVDVMSCAKPTPDAGESCNHNRDCSTLCIAKTDGSSSENICYGWSSAIGECLRLAENPSRETCFD